MSLRKKHVNPNPYQYSGVYPYNWNFIYQKQDADILCYICGGWMKESQVTKEHIYPKCKGGQAKAPACYGCNSLKDDLLPIQFALWYSSSGLAFGDVPDDAAVV